MADGAVSGWWPLGGHRPRSADRRRRPLEPWKRNGVACRCRESSARAYRSERRDRRGSRASRAAPRPRTQAPVSPTLIAGGERDGQGLAGGDPPRRPGRGATGPSLASTARPSRTRCSRPRCSASSAEPSPTRGGPSQAWSRSPIAARSSSTRSACCQRRCRPSCSPSSRSGHVRRLGEHPGRVRGHVRCVAASLEDLHGPRCAARRFREDLYHRLAVVTLTAAAAARARRRCHWCSPSTSWLASARTTGFRRKVLKADARTALLAHAWPGNVRELANVIERAACWATVRQ